MALNVAGLEGNEIADDFTRNAVQGGRWSDAWSVFTSNFFKIFIINLFVLITFVPGIVLMWYRGAYISYIGSQYPFNSGIVYPFYTDLVGMTEGLRLSADLTFMSLLIVAGFFASLGIAGAAYSIRKLLLTHGEFSVKSFFHGIKVNYANTVLPVTIFLIFYFATKITGDWMHLEIATGGNAGGSITAYVFVIIATVLVGFYCAWMFSVGTAYRMKFLQIIKNSFSFSVRTIEQAVFIAAFALIPVWLFIPDGICRTVSYILFGLFGFSYILLCWTAFSQWAFDQIVQPNFKAEEKAKSKKSEKELAQEKVDDERRIALELVAAGKSELCARPILPISDKAAITVPAGNFTRGDIAAADAGRAQLQSKITAYEKQHENEPLYAEYNRLFADREKALQPETKKGKKRGKISSDNLLR